MVTQSDLTVCVEDGEDRISMLDQLSDIGQFPIKRRPWFTFWALLPEMGEGYRVKLRVILFGCKSLDNAGQVWRIEGEIRHIGAFSSPKVKEYLAPLKFFEGRYDTVHLEGQLQPGTR